MLTQLYVITLLVAAHHPAHRKHHHVESAPLVAPAPAAPSSAATPAAAADQVVFKKHTVIDLTGAMIEGDLTKPEGSYIVNRKVSRFSSLIKVRENFVPEILASPDLL